MFFEAPINALLVEVRFKGLDTVEIVQVRGVKELTGPDGPAVIPAQLRASLVFRTQMIVRQRATFGDEFNMPDLVVIQKHVHVLVQ